MIEFRSFPKSPRQENKRFRDLARGQDCMLRIPNVCCGDPETTVLAHSNRAEHNKGGMIKAHDFYGVFSCHTCHHALDQTGLDPALKVKLFDWGLERMAVRLMQIATDPQADKRDREAAQWGLDGLGKPRLA